MTTQGAERQAREWLDDLGRVPESGHCCRAVHVIESLLAALDREHQQCLAALSRLDRTATERTHWELQCNRLRVELDRERRRGERWVVLFAAMQARREDDKGN
jgi:pyruvate dehydrogenase complex dehydrogenase (E1) component